MLPVVGLALHDDYADALAGGYRRRHPLAIAGFYQWVSIAHFLPTQVRNRSPFHSRSNAWRIFYAFESRAVAPLMPVTIDWSALPS